MNYDEEEEKVPGIIDIDDADGEDADGDLDIPLDDDLIEDEGDPLVDEFADLDGSAY